jgi:thiol:disulfide interchange protein DsbD
MSTSSFPGYRAATLVAAVAFLLCGCSKPESSRVTFAAYDAKAFEAARAEKLPIVIYVTADWCAACQKLGREALWDAKVKEALEPFARLKVDYSDRDDKRTKALLVSLKVEMLPTLIFIDKRGAEAARLSKERSVEAILEAAAKAAS